MENKFRLINLLIQKSYELGVIEGRLHESKCESIKKYWQKEFAEKQKDIDNVKFVLSKKFIENRGKLNFAYMVRIGKNIRTYRTNKRQDELVKALKMIFNEKVSIINKTKEEA